MRWYIDILRIYHHHGGNMTAYTHTTSSIGRALVGLAVLWGMIGLAGVESWAGDSELDRATLRGLQGVDVIVENLTPEVERAGLTARQLQTDVELRLRKAGIPVLTSAERVKVPGKPVLYIYLHVVPRPDERLTAYSITVELYQMVSLETDAFTTTVSTWGVGSTGSIGSTRLATLRDDVRDYTDRFINAYLSVHTRPAGSPAPSSASPRRDLVR
jgi:hypothetical protein